MMTNQENTLPELPVIRELTSGELDSVGGGHPINPQPEPTLGQDIAAVPGTVSSTVTATQNSGAAFGLV